MIVACLGLFGLAAFTAERRTKEIGIRKVLGARTRDIVRLLAWQFSKPVIIANLIAWPAAWWAMREWLNTFDARIDLGPPPFVLAGLLALAIAIGTIAGHAFGGAGQSDPRAPDTNELEGDHHARFDLPRSTARSHACQTGGEPIGITRDARAIPRCRTDGGGLVTVRHGDVRSLSCERAVWMSAGSSWSATAW